MTKTISPGFVCGLIGAAAVLVACTTLLSSGFQSLDEGVYYLQARALVAGHPFALHTGYAEIPSPEFLYFVPGITAHTQVGIPGVVGQYPIGYPVLAAAPLAALGPVGVVIPNLLACVVCLALIGNAADRLWGTRSAAYFAAGLTFLCSFWLDHTFAMWPHVAAIAPVLGAIVLVWPHAGDDVSFRRAVAAGLLVGVAVSMRLDSIVLAAGLAAALALPPTRRRTLIGMAVGVAPWLVVLALINQAKFGIANPFSYGTPVDVRTAGAGGYARLVPLGLSWFVAIWMAWSGSRRGPEVRKPVLAGAVLIAAIVTAASWRTVAELLVGAYVIIVDLGALPDELADMQRLDSGAIVFGGTVKKSLLQSCPWLLGAAWFVARSWRRGDVARRRGLERLLLPAFALVVFFSLRAWHGGASHNVRYLLPVIPLMAIASAGLVDEFGERLSRGWRWALGLGSAIAVVACMFAGVSAGGLEGTPPADQEIFVREIPMMLSLLSLIGVVVGLHEERGRRPRVVGIAGGLVVSALAASSGLGAFDAWRSRSARVNAARFAAEVAAVVEPEAVVITAPLTATFGLLERDGIALAAPQADGGRDIGRVASRARELGKRVYFVLPMTAATQETLSRHVAGWPLVVKPVSSGYGVIFPRGQ